MKYIFKKHEIAYWWPDIEFHQKLKFCLTASLTTVASLEAKRKGAQPQFYTTTTNSPVGCAFWGSNKWGASAPGWFLFSSIRLFFFFMQRNHTDVLIFQLTLSLSNVSNCTTSILKCLCYSRGIGQVQIR